MKLLAVTANLGAYDTSRPWERQVLPLDIEFKEKHLTDESFPPRPLAMTSRLQVGIVKWFAHDLFPDESDRRILWVDASCSLTRGNEAHLWLLTLGQHDIALFKHPERKTIQEEYEFIKAKMEVGSRYLLSRYEHEWLDGQFEFISKEGYADAPLFASTAFIYEPTRKIKEAFKEVAFMKFRYHLHDQLALAYALAKFDINVKGIDGDYQKSGYLTFVRNKK